MTTARTTENRDRVDAEQAAAEAEQAAAEPAVEPGAAGAAGSPPGEPAAGGDRGGLPPRSRSRLRWIPLVVLSVLALLAAGAGLYAWVDAPPGENSVDAGFARDMSTHHAQAVTMSMVVVSRSQDPSLRAIGQDIALTQQREIGVMSSWLTTWGLAHTGTAAPMSWMRTQHGEHGHAPGDARQGGGSMPGMASEQELTRLGAASGKDLDVLFLTLMIRHHRGGAPMAQEAALRAEEPQVGALARAMVSTQTAEIETMQAILARLGAPPA